MIKWRISFQRLILLFLIFFSILPNAGIAFKTFGFTWTGYRLCIPLCLIVGLFATTNICIDYRHPISKWVCFMLIWSIYGLVLLFIGKYSDLHRGFVEWLSIFNGFIVVYLLNLLLRESGNRDFAIKVIYIMLNFLIVVGLVEIFTGLHLPTSGFCDKTSDFSRATNKHQATGFMYNMNDFSACITCLATVLLDDRLGKKRLLSLVAVILINQINDATTCTLAIVFFVFYYFLMLYEDSNNRVKQLKKITFWVLCVGALLILFCIGDELAKRNDFIGALVKQIVNANNSSGSLFHRIQIYKDGISAWLSCGIFGMGPAGFSVYFLKHPSVSGLINPHSLFLEILTQYGIVIFVWFCGLLLWTFHIAKTQYGRSIDSQKRMRLMVIAFTIVYSITSFASSSFIGYSYQWLLIAVMCSYLNENTSKLLYVLQGTKS